MGLSSKASLLLFNVFNILAGSESTLESSFPLTVLPLKFRENAKDQRIYYSEDSVLNAFKFSNFAPVNSSTPPTFGLATPDTECDVIDTLCPQLTQIFHVNINGVPRLVAWHDLKDNDTMEIVEEAGYIGSWPGYCGTANGALVEMYSPILKGFRYLTSNEEVLTARFNKDRLFWRPTKVLGYLFDATVPERTVNYPFNSIKPFDNVVFNKILLTLRPILRVKSGSGLLAFTTSFRNNEYLQEYKFDKVLNVSLIDQSTNVTVISDACGKLRLVYEFYNPETRAYRLKLNTFDLNEEMVKRAGYVFREEASARRCLGEVDAIYEFQNPEVPTDIHYTSSADEVAHYTKTLKWTNLGQIGFSSWGNFAFAKR